MRAILTSPLPQNLSGHAQPLIRATRQSPQRDQALEDLVASCVRDAFGDAATAAQLLQDRIQSNRRALKELTQPLLADACFKAVSARIKANRPPEDDWNTDPDDTLDTSGRLHTLAQPILDSRLPSGKLIRDAFAPDLREAADTYSGRAEVLQHRARWMRAIAAQLPRGMTVEMALDEAELTRLLSAIRS